MNKSFKEFLERNKDRKGILRPDGSFCEHTENEWCGNCINKGTTVEVTLPDGSISKGTIFTNFN